MALLCSPAAAASPDEKAETVYVRAGGGVMFLDLPESSPFIDTDNNEVVVELLDHYDASFQPGALVNLAVGGEYTAFRRTLFTEVRGFFTSHSTTDVTEYERTSGQWNELEAMFPRNEPLTVEALNQLSPAEREARRGRAFGNPTEQMALISRIEATPTLRLAGWIGAIDGPAFENTPNFAWGDPMRIRTQREVEYGGSDVVTGTAFEAGGHTITLFIGPSFKRIKQESDVFAFEANRAPDVNFMTLQEELTGSYYGGVIGGRFDVPFGERWLFAVNGEVRGYHLKAEYEGRQRTFLSSTFLASGDPDDLEDVRSRLTVDDSTITASAALTLSLSTIVLEHVTLQVGTGFEYLADVPVMRYADVGQRFAAGVSHPPARIEFADAFGVLNTLSVGLAF